MEGAHAAAGAAAVSVPGCAAPPHNPHMAVDDPGSTPFETAVPLDVLVNNSDPEGDPITAVRVGTATDCTVTDNGRGQLSRVYRHFDDNLTQRVQRCGCQKDRAARQEMVERGHQRIHVRVSRDAR